ncbi:hypothetical protein [Lysinibacillus fusiformis]|uniref:hypothetical protein n=1 Tax=Lysinibacillus fusiformis TaxID=28031 RepID=UPI000468BD5C|nr:hypothetical protein [Lysinibacillus fusiformis]
MSKTQKRKILYGRTLRELQKQIKFQEKAAYVPISAVKFYENEKYPYQILVEKKWLAKGRKNELNKTI